MDHKINAAPAGTQGGAAIAATQAQDRHSTGRVTAKGSRLRDARRVIDPARSFASARAALEFNECPRRIDFESINRAAVARLPDLLARWLPDGRRRGTEWVALNPRRLDRHRGSFSVNLKTGRWGDFATGDRGGDPIALAAFLFALRQSEAAERIAAMLGMEARP